MKTLFFFISLLFGSLSGICLVQPANIFTSHMVLQREKPIRVWGTAAAGEKISVSLAGNTKSVKASKSGEWELVLPALSAGGPHTMQIKGKNEIVFDDILIGEVWVCSGQSNMEWPVSQTINADKEKASANYPQIRHFQVAKATSLQPEKEIKEANWIVCSPETVGGFTAVGYFFAREVYEKLKIPIGLVHSSWGGTHVETWISGPSFFGAPEFSALKTKLPSDFNNQMADRKKKSDEMITKVQGSLPDAAEVKNYPIQNYNDQNWATMTVPGLWESKGLEDLDGIVWFRKSFNVPADIALKNVKISLGKIDDVDSTFVNGVFIGSTAVYSESRLYDIPDGLLKGTGNVIAVKVMDSGGGGGIYGEPGDLFVNFGITKLSLSGDWKFRIEKMFNTGNSVNPNAYPTLLYNAMINPIIKLSIRGFLWYQGESNAGRAKEYNTSFPLMITDWRKQWKDSTLPFYFVQLTHFIAGGGTNAKGGSEWAELREAQEKTLRLPNTGMAVIIDIGETNDIHPKNKQDVGKRLALIALAKTYSQSIPYEGPHISTINMEAGRARLGFKNVEGGWKVDNKYGYINGFEVAGADKQWHYARAWIENGEIIVVSDIVKSPVAVRYAWADDPADLNLFNKNGLPAIPFRSDDWPGKTDGNKFNF